MYENADKFGRKKFTKKCMEMGTNPDISPNLSAFPYISS